MIHTSISYDSTRLTAGQAATTAPTNPRDQPWATFAASEATMPSTSIQRNFTYGVVYTVLGRCWALPGFGHPVTCPAPGGLAELPGQLALRQRFAHPDAGAVGGHCGSVEIPVRTCGSHQPWKAGRLAGLIRHLVRRVPARSACLARARHRGHRNRAVPAAGREAGVLAVQVLRSGIRHPSSSELETGAVVVRLRSAVVHGWLAAQVARRCGTDDPHQQLIAAHQADRGPGRDRSEERRVGKGV